MKLIVWWEYRYPTEDLRTGLSRMKNHRYQKRVAKGPNLDSEDPGRPLGGSDILSCNQKDVCRGSVRQSGKGTF